MSKMKKCFLVPIMVFVLIFSFNFSGQSFYDPSSFSLADNVRPLINPTKQFSQVSWNSHYDNIGELYTNSDLVAECVFLSSNPENRFDLVFTHEYYKVVSVSKGSIAKGSIIDVLKTGGSIDGLSTPVPTEQPLYEDLQLEANSLSVILFLKESEYDTLYGQYYLISGGYQGFLLKDTSHDNLTYYSTDIQLFANSNKVNSLGTRTEATPPSGIKWGKYSLKYYLSTSIATTYNTSVRNYVKAGIDSWNGLSSWSLTENTLGASNDIFIFMNDYGSTEWDGLTSFTQINETEYVSSAHTSINVNSYKNAPGAFTTIEYLRLWREIACHESGHSIGLHHYSGSMDSVMKEHTNEIYNVSVGTPLIYTPQTVDINGLSYLTAN